jgi:hypothetical protein
MIGHRKITERSFGEDMDFGLIQDFVTMIRENESRASQVLMV